MTPAVVQRIVWKEYRTFRGFWISIAVLTLLVQGIAVFLDWWLGGIWNRVRETSPLSFMALATTVFYMLGVGATIFSLEHEQSTYPQLRAWPAGFQEVWLGKLLFVLLSSVLLGAFLRLPRAAFGDRSIGMCAGSCCTWESQCSLSLCSVHSACVARCNRRLPPAERSFSCGRFPSSSSIWRHRLGLTREPLRSPGR